MFDSKLYKETFSQVQVSEETLAEVLNMTQKNKHGGFRAARMILIAAVLTALLATTVFAYVGFTQYENPMQMLGTFFGDKDKQSSDGQIVHETYFDQEYDLVQPTIERVPLDEKTAEEDVVPYVSDVGESVTYEDYTLTVEAHLYDSATNCGVVYYTIENPNGVSGYEVFDDGEIWWPDGEMVYFPLVGENYIVENETTETKLTVASYYCGADGVDYLNVAFYADESNALLLPLNDGGGMESISLADGDIVLSPVALRLNTENMEFLYDGVSIYAYIERLVIRYKDGTEYLVYSDEPYTDNSTYSSQNYEGTVTSYTFNRLVDIDEVEAVIINDVEYTDVQALTADRRGDISGYEGPDQPAATEPANP